MGEPAKAPAAPKKPDKSKWVWGLIAAGTIGGYAVKNDIEDGQRGKDRVVAHLRSDAAGKPSSSLVHAFLKEVKAGHIGIEELDQTFAGRDCKFTVDGFKIEGLKSLRVYIDAQMQIFNLSPEEKGHNTGGHKRKPAHNNTNARKSGIPAHSGGFGSPS